MQQILVTVVIGTFVLLLLQRGCNKAATETVHKYKSLTDIREGGTVFPFSYTHSVAAFVALLLYP